MTRVIGVVSGKGGVGKTTTVVNLGVALRRLGKSVTILDSNMKTPNISLHLGLKFNPVYIQDIIEDKVYLPQATYIHETGLRIIPADLSVRRLNVDTSELKKHIHKFVGDTDYLLVDCAPGLGKEALSGIEASDEFLIVTNPETPAVVDGYKTYQIIKKMGTPTLGIVVNRCANSRDELKNSEIASFFEHEIIANIPEDKNMRTSIQRKKPIVRMFPNSPASRAFNKLAIKIEGIEKKRPFLEKFLEDLLLKNRL